MSAAPDPSAVLRTIPLNSPVVEVWFHGIYTCLFGLTVWSLLFRAKASLKNAFWLGLVIFMYTTATIHAGLSWGLLTNAFINHGATPGVVNALGHQPAWFRALGATMFSVNILIADCLFIWRCWVIWEHSWTTVALPILATLAGTVCAVISIIGQVDVATTKTPGVVPQHFINFSTPYFALSLATSFLTTLLIIFRIVLIKYQTRTAAQFRQNYSQVLEILTESAALYAFTLMLLVIFLAQKSQNLDYMQDIQSQISGITPTLIIFRVALGHARPDAEWSTAKTNTHLEFGGTSQTKQVSDVEMGEKSESSEDTTHSGIALELPQISTVGGSFSDSITTAAKSNT